MKNYTMYLQLFGEGGAAGASGSSGAEGSGAGEGAVTGVAPGGSDLANVVYGKPEGDFANPDGEAAKPKESKTKAAQFEELIKGEYKEEFAKRTQGIIDERFKSTKGMQERAKQSEPILKMLADKYGVKPDDLESLAKAIDQDDSFYKQAAMDAGLTVEQYKQLKTLERENAELVAAQQAQQREEESQRIYSEWLAEGQAMAEKYGLEGFDFNAEVQNPEFTRLLAAGVGVEGAYKAIHFDDMVGGAMAQTASNVRTQLAQSVGQRNARPTEGSLMTQSATTFKTDVNALSRADREEIERRAQRGEIIRF